MGISPHAWILISNIEILKTIVIDKIIYFVESSYLLLVNEGLNPIYTRKKIQFATQLWLDEFLSLILYPVNIITFYSFFLFFKASKFSICFRGFVLNHQKLFWGNSQSDWKWRSELASFLVWANSSFTTYTVDMKCRFRHCLCWQSQVLFKYPDQSDKLKSIILKMKSFLWAHSIQTYMY